MAEKPHKSHKEEVKIDDMSDMIIKWTSVPIGITTVLVAGSVLNLIGYFLRLKDDLGFDPTKQEFVRWAVAGGYYGGFIAGPILAVLSTRL